MKSKSVVVVASGVAFAFLVGTSLAADRDASLYVGVKTCKMCHKKPEEGEQFKKWSESPHAKAYERLATPEAKEAAAKLGIDDPQKSGKCLKCHSTAYNFGEEVATTEIPVEEGISCESCHGPGKNYKKKETMKDHDASIAAGMVHPAKEKSCTLCHNEQSPTFNPAEWDLEKAYEKIKHERPK